MYKIPPGGGGGSIASSRPNRSVFYDAMYMNGSFSSTKYMNGVGF